MAQIRKYGNGGEAEKKENSPTLFHWEGIGDYDVKDMETTYARNLETYLNSLNVDEEDKARVRDISYRILQNTKNGVITTRDASGKWLNVPIEYQSTGQFNMRGPRKKKYEKDSNYYNNLSYQVIDNVLRDTALYGTPKEQTKAYDKRANFDLDEYLLKYYFNNGQFDPNYWDYSKARTEMPLRVAEFKKKVIDSNLPEADKNDLLGRIGQVEAAFQTEDINDDYYGLARLMNDPRRWFDKDYVPVSNDPNQKPLTEEERKAQEDKRRFDEAYQARLASDNDYWTSNYRSWKYDPSIKLDNPDRYNVNQLQDLINWNLLSEGNVTNPIISYFNQYISDKDVQEELNRLGYYENGWYYLPVSSDLRTNMITRVNPNTNTLERVPLTSFKLGQEDYTKRIQLELAKELGIVGPWTTSIPSNKEGGIIKAQEGRAINTPIRVNKNKRKSSNLNTSTQKAESKSKSNDEWTGADYANMASVILDLSSAGTSYIPVYGTAISAGTGIASSLSNFGADWARDGLDWGDAGRLGTNLGFDLLGLIPGLGTGAKAGKIAKTLLPLIPKIKNWINVVGVASLGAAGVQAMDAIEDIEKNGLNWNNASALAPIINAIATKRSMGKGLKQAEESGALLKKYSLDLPSGDIVNLDPDTYKKLITATTKEAQEAVLKEAGFNVKLDSKLGNGFTNWIRGKIKQPVYISTTKEVEDAGKFSNIDWAKRVYSENYIPTKNKSNKNPEANVGNNKVVDDVNQATKNWWKEHKKDVKGATNSFAEAMRKADEYNKRYGRLALPPKTQGPEIPSNSKKSFVMQESIPVSRPAQKDVDKSIKEFYKEINTTILPTPKLTGIEINYTPPILRTPSTITFEQAQRNNYQIEKLRQDRALNNAKNQDKKEFNRLVDKENKERKQKKLEEKRKNYSEMVEDLVRKQQVKNYSSTLPNRSANQVGSEDFSYYGYQKDMSAKTQKELAEKRSKITGQENQKKNSEKKKLAKKKKTSKESKGYVNKHQQGGIVKGAGGFRIGAKDKWTLDDRNKALANYNFAGDVQSYLNSGSDIDSYIAAFNAGEDLYDKMVGDTNYFTNMSGNYRKEDPLAYQRQMTFRNTNKGFDDLIRGSIIGYGTTEGASNFDKYLGDRTYNRTLGYLTPEQATAYNKQISQFGMELFQSPNNKNHYRLRKIPGWVDPKSSSNLISKTLSDTINNEELPQLMSAEELIKSAASGRNAQINSNSTKTNNGLIGIIPDLLGTARLAGTIWTNNRIAKDIKNSLSPLLIDPPQIRRSVVGDLATRNYMEKLGAEANRIGSRPITSDTSLQLGQALDYNNRANEYRVKGYLADKQAIDKTSLAAQEAAEQNAIARVDAANRNRASMLGIRQAKANVEAQRKSANWSQAVAPWLMDKEFRMRQNQKILNNLNYEGQDFLDRQALEKASDQAQAKLNQAKQQFLNSGGTEETWVGSPQYNAAMETYNQEQKTAANIYLKSRLDNQRAIYSSPWIMFKSGGKLSYAEKAALEHDKAVNKALLNDSKEFNKLIRESKKENNKLILSLSGLSKELVIKSMTYAG